MKGYVYIISNKAMPGLFKVGYTLKDPALRAQELNSTGVPHPYLVEFEILVDEPYTLEQNVHSYLKRFNESKEWFRCDFDECVMAIHYCYKGKVYYERIIKREPEQEYERRKAEKQKRQAAEEQARREQQVREEQKQREEEEKTSLDKELSAYIQRQRKKTFYILPLAGAGVGLFLSQGFSDLPIFFMIFICAVLGAFVINYLTPKDEWEKWFFKEKEKSKK